MSIRLIALVDGAAALVDQVDTRLYGDMEVRVGQLHFSETLESGTASRVGNWVRCGHPHGVGCRRAGAGGVDDNRAQSGEGCAGRLGEHGARKLGNVEGLGLSRRTMS